MKQNKTNNLFNNKDDFKDMSQDEIKVKLDQIYDWNDKSN